nr:hypothetical protein [Campylobacter jejuni]
MQSIIIIDLLIVHYVKLDLARALKKYKLDDDYSSKAYVSFGKYF